MIFQFSIWRLATMLNFFNPYVAIGGIFYHPDAIFTLLFRKHLELWQWLLCILLNICGLKNAEKNSDISITFSNIAAGNGHPTKRARKSYVKGLFSPLGKLADRAIYFSFRNFFFFLNQPNISQHLLGRFSRSFYHINDKNCSLSIALTAMDQKLQKS